MLENVNRIIEALNVRYLKSDIRYVHHPVYLNNTRENKNILVQAVKGSFYASRNGEQLNTNDFYFVPASQPVFFKHGKAKAYKEYQNEGFISVEDREEYLKTVLNDSDFHKHSDVFSLIGFDVFVYGSIPFFQILEMPCMHIPANEEMNSLIWRILSEEKNNQPGSKTLINCYAKQVVIHIIRYCLSKSQYKKNIEKIAFLMDKRLVKIIQYVEENLGNDLSNEKIAEVAYVSKDYVGQFFKTTTGHNLQDYVENKRLDHAHLLLSTSSDNVQEISLKVGFKDQAYFSRRFKMKFNENAKDVRKAGQSMV